MSDIPIIYATCTVCHVVTYFCLNVIGVFIADPSIACPNVQNSGKAQWWFGIIHMDTLLLCAWDSSVPGMEWSTLPAACDVLVFSNVFLCYDTPASSVCAVKSLLVSCCSTLAEPLTWLNTGGTNAGTFHNVKHTSGTNTGLNLTPLMIWLTCAQANVDAMVSPSTQCCHSVMLWSALLGNVAILWCYGLPF